MRLGGLEAGLLQSLLILDGCRSGEADEVQGTSEGGVGHVADSGCDIGVAGGSQVALSATREASQESQAFPAHHGRQLCTFAPDAARTPTSPDGIPQQRLP